VLKLQNMLLMMYVLKKIGEGGIIMGWAIILAIAYIPLFYRMQRRLHQLEQEVRELKQRWKET
jgi:hypothetical protein